MIKLNELTVTQAHNGLIKKEFSSVELTTACLARIDEVDEKIGAFLFVDKEGALTAAKEVDKKIAAGLIPGPIEGVPVAIKDNMLVKGLPCTAGSKMLENYQAVYDATVVKKLKEAGAVILGKTNMDEFAMGSSTETSAFKKTKNPHNLKCVPGGSSGGSAAAVAAHECIFALGSDTGGSIRQPASLCGVVGFKPTYGSVSRYGLIAMASSLDVIGPLTKTVEDARIVYEVIKGVDEKDATTCSDCHPDPPIGGEGSRRLKNGIASSPTAPRNDSLESLRIGIPREYFVDGMDLETEKLVREGMKKLEKAGAKIVEVSLPHTEYALAVYYILMPAEVSANLARFDGIRYGFSITQNSKLKTQNLLDVYSRSRSQGFGEEVKRRVMLGTYTLSVGYRDAYYGKAQTVRALIKQDFDKIFHQVDYLATPTSPTPAWLFGERLDDPLTMYLSDIFTASANLVGIPAISLPCGAIHGLPVGLQLMAGQGQENKLFALGSAFEQA